MVNQGQEKVHIYLMKQYKKSKTKQIEKEFDADAVEMEGAAIAQVCKLSGIPWVILRSISDVANGENAEVHEHYLQRVSERCAAILKEAIC